MGSSIVLPIYTSYFANKNIYNGEYTIINITRKQPRWITDEFPTYHYAVPTILTLSSWCRSNKDEAAMRDYVERYYHTRLYIFGENSPEIHESNLEAFAREMRLTYGEKPLVFTCYESIGNFCHRLIYTTYLKLTTGIVIPELGYKQIESTISQDIITDTLKQLIKGVSL